MEELKGSVYAGDDFEVYLAGDYDSVMDVSDNSDDEALDSETDRRMSQDVAETMTPQLDNNDLSYSLVYTSSAQNALPVRECLRVNKSLLVTTQPKPELVLLKQEPATISPTPKSVPALLTPKSVPASLTPKSVPSTKLVEKKQMDKTKIKYIEMKPIKKETRLNANQGKQYKKWNVALTSSSDAAIAEWETCLQCIKVFHGKKTLAEHFQRKTTTQFLCPVCSMHLNNTCALKAHVSFHKLRHNEETKLIKLLQCPECGMRLGEGIKNRTELQTYMQNAVLHLEKVCFHSSRFTGIGCSKCGAWVDRISELENHIQEQSEYYFKCTLCPMVGKNMVIFKGHYAKKHSSSLKEEIETLYICHVCSLLIPGQTAWVEHFSIHIKEHTKNIGVTLCCLHCKKLFNKKECLNEHMNEHHDKLKGQFLCGSCNVKFVNPINYLLHVLDLKCCPSLTRTFYSNCKRRRIVGAGDAVRNTCSSLHVADSSLHVADSSLHVADSSLPVADSSLPVADSSLPVADSSLNVGDSSLSDIDSSLVDDSSSTINPEKCKKLPSDRHCNMLEYLSRQCVRCEVMFTGMEQRERHLSAHFKKGEYICLYCDYMMAKTSNELKNHERSCFVIQRKKTNSTTGLVQQINHKHVDVDKAQLPETSKACRPKAENGFHPCRLCGIVFDTEKCLEHHLLVHTDKSVMVMVYYCQLCKGDNRNEPFGNIKTLKHHMKTEHSTTGTVEFKVSAVTDSEVLEKVDTHEDQNSKGSSFTSSELSINTSSPEAEYFGYYKCVTCGHVFKSKDQFIQHMLDHKAETTGVSSNATVLISKEVTPNAPNLKRPLSPSPKMPKKILHV